MYGSYCKTTAYRIEHKDLTLEDFYETTRDGSSAEEFPFYIGPYTLSQYVNNVEDNIDPAVTHIQFPSGNSLNVSNALKLKNKLAQNEMEDNPRISADKAADLYNNYSVKYNRALPVSSSARRPGPREDLYLADFMKSIPGGSWIATNCAFGFYNEDQLNNWLYDSEERILLKNAGFVVREYKQIDAVIGHKQSLLFHLPNTTSRVTDLL